MTTPNRELSESIDRLIMAIRDGNDDARGTAWQTAGKVGAPAIAPLSRLMTQSDFEVARSAKRAVHQIVRRAGRPGAESEAKAVEQELIALLRSDSPPVRREALWWLSEVGGEAAVAPMAALLANPDAREDARCALMRIPGESVSSALHAAFASAPESFRFALADSLRRRGAPVEGYPSQKLTPTKQTTVH